MTKNLIINTITFDGWNWVSIATMTWFMYNIPRNLDFIKPILEKSHTHLKKNATFLTQKSK